jgi:hypothetical protein
MRGAIFIGTILLALVPATFAESALDAVKLLPDGAAARIARIEGREGTPSPDRWYILTQDPTADKGVHEFVVSAGQVVASRSLSQFAESLKPADMLGSLPLIDSDTAARIAEDFAAANGHIVSSISYDLKKDPATGTPAWTVSCMDDTGIKLGSVVVTAGKGSILSHKGFPKEPSFSPSPTPAPDLATAAETPAVASTPAAVVATSSPIPDGTVIEPVAPVHHHHHPSPSPKPQGPVTKTLDSVGRTLQKFLPF